jgi:hypothetical protein
MQSIPSATSVFLDVDLDPATTYYVFDDETGQRARIRVP